MIYFENEFPISNTLLITHSTNERTAGLYRHRKRRRSVAGVLYFRGRIDGRRSSHQRSSMANWRWFVSNFQLFLRARAFFSVALFGEQIPFPWKNVFGFFRWEISSVIESMEDFYEHFLFTAQRTNYSQIQRYFFFNFYGKFRAICSEKRSSSTEKAFFSAEKKFLLFTIFFFIIFSIRKLQVNRHWPPNIKKHSSFISQNAELDSVCDSFSGNF